MKRIWIALYGLVMVLNSCAGQKAAEVPKQPVEGGIGCIEQVEDGSLEMTVCEPDDWPMMVKLGGVLYQYQGESDIEARCGLMDGTIESTTDGIPEEDGQGNFGTGFGYQYVGVNQIDVWMPEENGGCWARFVTDEKDLFFGTVLEVREDVLLVEPEEGSWVRSSSDQVVVSLDGLDYWDGEALYDVPVMEGDVVEVVCGTGIEETYPARVRVYDVWTVEEEESCVE